jgi:hypothetical protein
VWVQVYEGLARAEVAALVPVMGTWPQFLAIQTSKQGCLCVLMAWKLISLRKSDLREQDENLNVFCISYLEITFYHFCILLHK